MKVKLTCLVFALSLIGIIIPETKYSMPVLYGLCVFVLIVSVMILLCMAFTADEKTYKDARIKLDQES